MRKFWENVKSVICYGFLMTEQAYYNRMNKILNSLDHFQAIILTVCFSLLIAFAIFVAGLGLTL